MKGQIVSINISPGGVPKTPVDQVVVQADRIQGDGRNHQKHDKPHRAVSLMGDNQLIHFHRLGYDVAPGILGENLTVRGIDVQSLEAGDLLEFDGGVVLEISEPRIPCYVLDTIDPKLKDEAWGCCGMMARVIKTGEIKRDESFAVVRNAIKEDREIWQHTAVILAGGQSRRMGRLKEGVQLADGRPMIQHIAEALESVAANVLVAGKCEGFPDLERTRMQRINDQVPGCGPLGGIEAVLSSGLDSKYLFVACDQPLLSRYLLRVLCRDDFESAFLRTEMGEKLDPFPGIISVSALELVRNAIQSNQFRVRQVLRELEPSWVTIDNHLKDQVKCINTPEELLELTHCRHAP